MSTIAWLLVLMASATAWALLALHYISVRRSREYDAKVLAWLRINIIGWRPDPYSSILNPPEWNPFNSFEECKVLQNKIIELKLGKEYIKNLQREVGWILFFPRDIVHALPPSIARAAYETLKDANYVG